MPDVTFKKVGSMQQLPAVQNGQITAVTETGQLFVDMDGERACYSGIVYSTDAAILATQTPWRNTLYIATDTGKLYVPDWQRVGGRWIYCGWSNLIEWWATTDEMTQAFATSNHTHTEYANTYHSHMMTDIMDVHEFVTYTSLITTLGGYSLTSHNHDTAYATIDHLHTGTYSPADHNHDTAYATIDHLHAGTYSLTSHNHDAAYCPKWTNATMANNAVTLSTRKQWRYGANDITTVTITLSTGTITEFAALATFGTSSATPTVTITATGSYTVKMVGTDCLDGTFTPYASTRYTIAFYWDGLYIVGKVSGYAYG